MRSPSSILLAEGDGKQDVIEFTQCVHCGAHVPVRASIERLIRGEAALGYCAKCDGVHCPQCADCVPFHQQLDNVESGRNRLAPRPVAVSVPRLILPE